MPPKVQFRIRFRNRDVMQEFDESMAVDVKTNSANLKVQSDNKNPEKKEFIEEPTCTLNIDIWFKISEYIEPRDIGNFALICRDTSIVVSSAKFWADLYRRYYLSNANLPECVKFQLKDCVRSLRSRVICSLFYLYKPLEERIKTGYSLSLVEGLTYVSCWSRTNQGMWIYCYKLWNCLSARSPRDTPDNSDSEDDSLSRVLYKLDNVFENPHEGITILVIYSKKYIPFPELQPLDMVLCSTRNPLTSDLNGVNMELKFSQKHRKSSIPISVLYFSVPKYKVLPWWHPQYKMYVYDEQQPNNVNKSRDFED